MKLSAPPPPPPESNQPGQVSEANAPNSPSSTTDSVPPETPGTPTAPKNVAWPLWFTGADVVLAALALILAFMVASFVARNTDIWLHLAAGKRLLADEYRLGTDPFSYSAADRPWVNHSLFFDVGAYLLYGGTGATLVVVKALAVALAFGLLIGIRRPGFAVWPWAAVAVVAVVAAAPRMVLSPIVGSVVFLAVTLFLLFRLPHKPNSWRFPAAIGVTFWLWANTDEWFFLGPLALALVLAGELIQQKFLKPAGEGEGTVPEPEPLGTLPDVQTLARALGIGVLACMLTPNHVRIWELPFELVGAKGVAVDYRLKPVLAVPLDEFYYAQSSLGRNVNGAAYAILFVIGGAALGLSGSRVRLAHIALWLGFATLSLWSIYAIPFLAVVAVPLIAGQLNFLSSRFTLKTWGDPKTRFLLLGSGGGRVFVLVLAFVACVLAWPGWVHPPVFNEGFSRRVAWAVEPDPGLKQAADQLQSWRSAGRLPPEARGLITSIDLANYCAWAAPAEKVFLNGRYNHHRAELPNFITVRAGLGLIRVNEDDVPKPTEVVQIFDKIGAEYVAVHSGPGDPPELRRQAREAMMRQWLDRAHCSAWYLDGRTAISGWRTTQSSEKPTFAALKLDPIVTAFAPGVAKLPAHTTQAAPPIGGWEDAFIRSPSLAPPGADETEGWLNYKGALIAAQQLRGIVGQVAGLTGNGVDGWQTVVANRGFIVANLGEQRPPPPDGDRLATAFLALRAARRAVATDPAHPDGYWALATALNNPDLPLSDADRAVGRITALQQCLNRMPKPDDYKPSIYAASPLQVIDSLVKLYLGQRPELGKILVGIPIDSREFEILTDLRREGYLRATRFLIDMPGQGLFVATADEMDKRPSASRVHSGPFLLPLDLAREKLQLGALYLEKEFRSDLERLKAAQKVWAAELKLVEDEVGRANNNYERRRAQAGQSVPAQVQAALSNNLVGEALRILGDKDANLGADFRERSLHAALSRVALELAVGRIEEASADLEALTVNPQTQQLLGAPQFIIPRRWLTYQKALLEGDYAGAGAVLQEFAGNIGRDPTMTPEQAKVKPHAYSVLPLITAMSPHTPLERLTRETLFPQVMRPYDERLRMLDARRSQDSEYFARRGLLSLYEGDNVSALKWLRQSRQPANPEWGFGEFRHQVAEEYIRLLELAEKRSGGK